MMKTNFASLFIGPRLVRSAALCLCLFFAMVTGAWPQTSAPTFTTFDAPGAGTGALQGTTGTGINASGAITGIYLTAPNVAHGYVRLANGTIDVFDAPGAGTGAAQGTFPFSINDSGVIIGFYSDANAKYHGFVCTAPCSTGTITTFNAPGAGTTIHQGTSAISINDSGVIVGYYSDANANYHGFVCTAPCSSITPINISGAGSGSPDQGTFPFSVNSAGVITGLYTDASNLSHGFVCTAPCTTGTTLFDAPGATTTGDWTNFFHAFHVGTIPLTINTAEVIAGIYSDASSVIHSFVRAANGTITSFDGPGAATSGVLAGTFPASINTAGDIAGLYFDASSVIHGFVRSASGTITPVDDPNEVVGSGSFHGTLAVNINGAGAVTGGYFDANGVFHGFVRAPGTTTMLTPSVNPSVYGQAVTFTATVSSGDVTPPDGETISFMQGATLLGTGTLSSGSAIFMTSTLAPGTSTITAVYPGDANFVGSTSNAISQGVNKAASSTGVVSSLNPEVSGQTVTFTATVTSTAGKTPTGSVTFFDGTTSLGTGGLNGSGMATFSPTTALAVGAQSITANYGGDGNYAPSISPAVSETVTAGGFATPPAGLTVTAGNSLPINLTFYAVAGTGTFSLSCVNPPAKSSCSFNPPNPVSIAPPPTGTTVVVTLATSSSRLPAGPSNRDPRSWPTPGIFATLAALLAGGAIFLRRAPKLGLALGMCLTIVALAMTMTSCGANSSSIPAYTGTTKGASTFTVMAVSTNNTTISVPVTVTVQ